MTTQEITLLSSPVPGAASALPLAATLYIPDVHTLDGLAAGLIVGHGAGSRKSRHAEFCRVACVGGFVVLALDFRGHGQSGGEADGPLELDIYAAAAHLRTLPFVDPEKICYRGSSMGGFYGLKAAKEARFAAMALVCPATESVILHGITELEAAGDAGSPRDTENPDLGRMAFAPRQMEAPVLSSGQRFPISADEPPHWHLPRLRTYFEEQQCLSLAACVECPVLLVHARADEVVPFTHTLLIAQSLAVDTTLVALQEGVHTTAQHDPHVHRLTVEWLQDQVTSCNART
jgi:pimeloyl-ACP methyl ester carboxylesterase